MPKDKRSSDDKKDRVLDSPYLLTRAQKIRRTRLLRDGWEPADLALARERHSRGARLRSRNRDEAGPADNPAVAVVVAVAEIDEESDVLESREEGAPQHDMAASFAAAVPLQSVAQSGTTASQAESAEAVPAQGQAAASAGDNEIPPEPEFPPEPEMPLFADPRPPGTPPSEIDENDFLDMGSPAVIEMAAAAAADAENSGSAPNFAETVKNTETTVDGPPVPASMGEMSVSSMINTTSVELDFGGICAPPPDVCSNINESSVDTSTMDSDAESI